jgi:hypothetical protein
LATWEHYQIQSAWTFLELGNLINQQYQNIATKRITRTDNRMFANDEQQRRHLHTQD